MMFSHEKAVHVDKKTVTLLKVTGLFRRVNYPIGTKAFREQQKNFSVLLCQQR